MSQKAVWKGICLPFLSPNNLRRVSWEPLHRNKPWQFIRRGLNFDDALSKAEANFSLFSCRRTHFVCRCALRTLGNDSLGSAHFPRDAKNSDASWSSLVWAIGNVVLYCFRNRPERKWLGESPDKETVLSRPPSSCARTARGREYFSFPCCPLCKAGHRLLVYSTIQYILQAIFFPSSEKTVFPLIHLFLICFSCSPHAHWTL